MLGEVSAFIDVSVILEKHVDVMKDETIKTEMLRDVSKRGIHHASFVENPVVKLLCHDHAIMEPLSL